MKNSKFLSLIFLFGLFFIRGNLRAQNLVPNGDFEQMTVCPTNISQIYSASFWFNPATWSLGGGSPDYFNQCANPTPAGVPYNYFGYQQGHSGVAYTGIVLFFGSGWREYIEVQLTSPLATNQCYHFEMYVNLCNDCRFTTDDIGIYFSDTLIWGFTNPLALPFLPQINNTTGFVFDTLNWTLITTDYIAAGGENYLIIGNFKDNSTTDTIFINNNVPLAQAYFFIDDVSITPCTGIEEQSEEAIKIYPNPVQNELLVSGWKFQVGSKTTMKIFDILGKETQPETKNPKTETKIKVSTLKSGIYFLEINDGNNLYRKKFLKE